MEKLLALIEGKKTYITAALIALGAGATALGYVIPEWVWALLGAIGLGSVRAAIKK
jgi:hypothetical protein